MRYLLFFMIFLPAYALAQNVGIGTPAPDASAALDVSAANKGVLVPRVALINEFVVNPITSPAQGLLVYNTTTNVTLTPGFYFWSHLNRWEKVASSSSGAVPKNGILLFEDKATIPGFTYIGYSNEDYFEKITSGTGSWSSLPACPIAENVVNPSFTFYNNKLFVWSGEDANYLEYNNTGAWYDVSTNTWTSMTTVNAPAGRYGNVTVTDQALGWMYIWGGVTSLTLAGTVPVLTNTGAEYDLILNTWRSLPASPLTARYRHAAVWQGSSMYIWGGSDAAGTAFADGAFYDRLSNSWTAMAASPLAARYGHSAIWTGSRMIIFGGTNGSTIFNDGAAYDPATNTWSSIAPNTQFSGAVHSHTATLGNNKMMVFGGRNSFGTTSAGTLYDLVANTWSSASPAPGASSTSTTFEKHSAVWTGNRLILAGGQNSFTSFGLDIVREYDPVANTWIFYNPLPEGKIAPAIAWTGSKLLLQCGSKSNKNGYEFNIIGVPVDIHVSKARSFFMYKKD